MPRKFLTSLQYARTGIRYLWRSQRNFRIHLFIAALVLLAAWWLAVSYTEFLILLLLLFLVIATEALNTAIEEAVNLAVITKKARAMVAKDVAAAAVLLVSVCAIIVGFLIFAPRVWGLLFKAGGG